MIKEIIKKEIIENIYELRFVVILLTFTTVMLTCFFLRLNEYKRDLEDYKIKIQSQEEFLKKYAHSRRIGAVARPHLPPVKFGILSNEIPIDLTRFQEEETFFDNPLKIIYGEIDIIFIFYIVGTLVIISISYDSFSREKENQTISVIFSNHLKRINFFIGKLLGSFLTSSIPFVLSILFISILILLEKEMNWRFLEWFSFLIIMILTFLYFLFFSLLGISISVATKSSYISVIVLLTIWILFNLLVPNISPFLGANLYKPPNPSELNRIIERIDQEREEVLREIFRRYSSKGYTDAQIWELEKCDEINQRYFEKIYKVQKDFARKTKIHLLISKNISCLSPTASYIYAVKEISGLGFSRIPHAQALFQNWVDTALNYLRKKEEEIKKKNPDYTFDDFIDVSDGPRFFYKEQPFVDRLKNALPYIFLLGIYTGILFIISVILFEKADVR